MGVMLLKTKDGQNAWIDPTQVRSLVGLKDGLTKLVLDGGHAVTVEGEDYAVRVKLRTGDFPANGGEVQPGKEALVSVTENASGAPDFALSLNRNTGEVFYNGRALSEMEDKGILLWAAKVVPVFLATGKRAPATSLAPDPLHRWAMDFGGRMATKLEANRHKGERDNWLKYSPDSLLARALEELREVQEAVTQGASPGKVWAEAADVANMVAMAADAYEARRNAKK